MWLFLNDAFLSIVHKDCPEGSLLVRARRPGDIEKVFGRRTKVTRATDADYLYRAVIDKAEVAQAIQLEVIRITYGNFKDSIGDRDLHDAASRVWCAMASLQNPPPYSEPYRRGKWTPVGPTTWLPEEKTGTEVVDEMLYGKDVKEAAALMKRPKKRRKK